MSFRFERFSRNNAILSVLMVVTGLVLVIWPGKSLEVAMTVLGVALLIGAAGSAISWYRDRHVVGQGYVMLALAILCLVAGIVVLAAPRGLIALLPRLAGIAIIVNGIVNLAQALDLRRAGGIGWTTSLGIAVLTILGGIVVVSNAFGIAKSIAVILGAVLVYNGASNLWIESRYRKARKG